MNLQEIESAIAAKCKHLRAAESAEEWRYFQGQASGAASQPDYDDGAWETVHAPITWSGAAGDVWLRRTFVFPEQIEGISTQGAQIELPFITPIHSTVFVDGVERVAEPSWLDTRAVPLALCSSYQPGQRIQVTLHAFQGDGFGLFLMDHAEISSVEDLLFRLEVVRGQMAFTYHLACERGGGTPEWRSAWEKAAAQLNLAALQSNRWGAWWQSVEAARASLQPMAAEAKTYTTHLAGHSHIDMNWLWTWDETVDVIRRDFVAADGLMERYPQFHFSQSQASTYRAIQDTAPDVLERVRARVAQGNWEVTASTWVEGDLNMSAGEALVRHFLLTRPYMGQLFGVRPRICWEPDTFGHAATLPQLLKQVGVDYYYFCRAGRGQPLFWWEGIDGSRVLAFNDFLGYNGVVDPSAVATPVLELSRRYGVKNGLFLYGVGDHGGGGTARDIERALALDAIPLLPHAELSNVQPFYAQVQSASTLPVIRGELNTTFEGCYTSHGDIKKLNRSCENGLLTAETLATLAATSAGVAYPIEELAQAWRIALFHQFHDIICGCAIGATYKDAAVALQPALDTAQATCSTAADTLAQAVDTGTGDGPRIVVWNQLAWTRTDVVRVPLARLGTAPQALVDESGRVLPVQVAGDELLFVAQELPALGCRVYRPTNEPASSDLCAEEDATLRNALLQFHVHPDSGAIDNLLDLENQRAVDTMSTWRGVERKESAGLINRLQILWEQPHAMSAWNIGDITHTQNILSGAEVRLVERGPVRATIEVRQQVLHSTVVQRYCLYAGLRRIDIETEIDWHERGGKDVDAPMLRATFKPQLDNSVATFEVPFAGLERNATGDEVPALRWADVSDRDYGFSLLNNAKYGHQAHGTTLGLTLVRSSYEPDNLPDQGLQTFAYALYPHAGDWRQASSDRRAVEFNQPAVAVVTDGHGGSLAPASAALTCEPAGIMVTAVKRAESGEPALIVRLVEMQGQTTTASLRWNWNVQRVERVNLLEEHLSDIDANKQGCTLDVFRYEVVTLKLYLEG